MSYTDIGEAVVGLIAFVAFCYFCDYVGHWRHLWKYQHNRIYREDHDRHQAAYRATSGPSQLTRTTHKILQFIADGGEQGRLFSEVQVRGENRLGDWPKGWDLRSAGFVENLIDQPDRVRITKAGRYALDATRWDLG